MAACNLRWIFLLFACFLTATNLYAQDSTEYIVSKKLYTYADGLPGREVSCAVEDAHGFMWFGTKNGICRFDGKNFLVFTAQKSGLYSNNIRSMVADKNHGIIICYQPKTNIYDAMITHMEVIDINTFKISSFDEFYSKCPFKEKDIATINLSQSGDNSIEILLRPFHFFSHETHRHINLWRLDSAGFHQDSIWVVKTISFNNDGLHTEYSLADFGDTSKLDKQNIFQMNNGRIITLNAIEPKFSNSEGKVMILYCLNYKYFTYFFSKSSPDKPILCPNNTYNGIKFSNEYQYWLSTNGTFGLAINNQTRLLHLVVSGVGYIPITDSTDPELIRHARILHVYNNKIGQLWLSTPEGVIKVSLKKKKFHKLFTLGQSPLWGNHSARGIVLDSGNIYAAVGDRFCASEGNEIMEIECNNVYGLFKDGAKFLAGCGQLRNMDRIQKKAINIVNGRIGEIWSIYRLNEYLLLQSGTPGLYIYDERNFTYKPVKYQPFSQPTIVYRIYRNSRSEILAVADNGLYILNKNGDVINCYSNKTKVKIPSEHINDVYNDDADSKIYWIATAGDGLLSWNRETGQYKRYGVDNGFLSEILCRIEPDSFGYLWISTDFGMARFNKLTGTAEVFTKLDGIAHNEFNRSSSYKGTDGTLCFGGIDGITYFNPANFIVDKNLSHYPFVVNIMTQYNTKNNREEDITNEYLVENKVDITNRRRNLSIKTVLLDYEERNHLYEYQVKGFENEWKHANDGAVEISGLPYGNYVLLIRAQNPDGSWNSSMISIPLHVVRPYYATWWFITMMAVLLTGMIMMIVKFRTRSLSKDKQKLEQTVELRTSELKSSLDEQTALLQELHHRVKNNLQIISSLISLQTNSSTDSSEIHSLNDASRRIRAVALVHEMLYKQDKAEIDIKFYLTELASTINELVNVQQLPIKFNLDVDNIVLKVDQAVALGMITSELISNSIKYAFTGVDHPEVILSLHKKNNGNTIVYIVKDNGPGNVSKDVNDKTRFGMRLIDIFSRQIKGSHSFCNNNGFTYELQFKL